MKRFVLITVVVTLTAALFMATAPAAEVLVAKLRASTPRGKRLRCAGDEACPENARGRIRVAES